MYLCWFRSILFHANFEGFRIILDNFETMKLLELFEKDLFKIVKKIKFRKINCEFQDKINSDIKDIKSSRKTLTPVDKTLNFYKITERKYELLLHNSITKT